MLEITGKHISQLNDADLRTLIGLLCEAELRLKNMPIAGVTWGGHQDAADGGIDVRVETIGDNLGNGFIPRLKTGFQVKKPKMPRKEILKEMCPGGKLREVIKKLGRERGAYIIVSGNDDTTDLTLPRRKKSMREALNGFENKENLFTDFYGQTRIASWVRCYPSIIIWVRNKIGNPIEGWKSYQNWSKNSKDTSEPYLVDENVRIYKGAIRNDEGLSVEEGINLIRTTLRKPNTSVRLVGLSGVGKTRLLQALFDERIGKDTLNRNQVIYTDAGHTQNPPPEIFAETLLAKNQPIILAVDNCSPKLHSSLNKICTTLDSQVTLITIEYDIRDDELETTDFFKLEPISNDLIEKIIQYQFQNINSTNARKIATFSGGNAKIAIALARTIKKGESIDSLKENELFERLFHQRNQPSESLLKSAESCSLVYSFNVEMEKGKDDEITLLSTFAGKSILELYADIAILEERELVQKRNKWRAILPHAIANRLATKALKKIPPTVISHTFRNSSDRLLKSFANRLSYLHKNNNAKEIAKEWLSENGLLGDLNTLNDVTLDIFKKVALIAPLEILGAIERSIKVGVNNTNAFTQILHINEFAKIVSAIAYDSSLFERCLNLLIHFHILDFSDKDKRSVEAIIETLFFIQYSRTHAPIDLRIKIVEKLLSSDSEIEENLGYSLLGTLLKAENFRPAHEFTYYNRKYNDFGYYPKSAEEINNWYTITINFCQKLRMEDGKKRESIKVLLAQNFDGLWVVAKYGFQELLESISRDISKEETWVDGWIAMRKTLKYDEKKMSIKQAERLRSLEKELAPKKLFDQVCTYVLSSDNDILGLIGSNVKGSKDLDLKAKELGEKVGNAKGVFTRLLPRLVSAKIYLNKRVNSFGAGLAISCNHPSEVWNKIVNQYKITDSKHHNYRILYGFLSGIGIRDNNLSDRILADALSDDFLITIFPFLQSYVPNDPKRWERIKKSIEIGRTSMWAYNNLHGANLTEDYEQLCGILSLLLDKAGGLKSIIHFLGDTVFGEYSDNKYPPNEKIKLFARNVLTKIIFDRNQDYGLNLDLKLGAIIMGCFDSSKSQEGELICENLVTAYRAYMINFGLFSETFQSLAKTQSTCFLDSLFGKNYPVEQGRGLTSDFGKKNNPIALIDDEIIITWCDEQPLIRYNAITASINLFKHNEENNQLELSDIAQKILIKTPNTLQTLDYFSEHFMSSSHTGSFVPILQKRLKVLQALKSHLNEKGRGWANNLELRINQSIRDWEERKNLKTGFREERFE